MNTRRTQGLTIIEVLIAIAIFAVVAAAVLAMFPTILQLNTRTRSDQAITINAKQSMERIRGHWKSDANFQAGSMPSGLTTSVNGYTCAASTSSQSSNAAGQVLIRRVTWTCTRTGQPTFTFTFDQGRPS